MKALIKKYPINARVESDSEVYLQIAWHDWIDEAGKPLTDENYGYALCNEAPDDVELSADDFRVEEHITEVTTETGEKVKKKYWTAIYDGVKE